MSAERNVFHENCSTTQCPRVSGEHIHYLSVHQTCPTYLVSRAHKLYKTQTKLLLSEVHGAAGC